jgi:hypothetical protein
MFLWHNLPAYSAWWALWAHPLLLQELLLLLILILRLNLLRMLLSAYVEQPAALQGAVVLLGCVFCWAASVLANAWSVLLVLLVLPHAQPKLPLLHNKKVVSAISTSRRPQNWHLCC